MILQHVAFLFSYVFYVVIYVINERNVIYPVYLFPFAVYLLLVVFSFADSYVNQNGFASSFKKYSKFLCAFLLLFVTPLFLKMNVPEPHNFIQRKLEIMLGVSYAVFLISCTTHLAFDFYFNLKNFTDLKKTFQYIVLFFFIFYFAASLWMNYANQPTGDEPEYILMAHSLIYDRDLDLRNNFEKKDYRAFYKDRELFPQGGAVKKGNAVYSYHPFMVSVIIAPFYLIGKRFGITVFMNFAAALLIGVLLAIFYKISGEQKASIMTAFIAGFSMPVINHVNNVATDVLSALVLSTAFYFLMFERNRYLIFSFLLMLSIWLHPRNAVAALCMFLLFVFYYRKNSKKVFYSILLQAVNLLLLFLINKIIYGAILVKQVGNGNSIFSGFGHNVISSLSGLFFDQEFGLFFYTPLFILIPAGYYFLYKIRKDVFYSLLFVFIPFLAFICSWDWRGGGGSSPRFFVPLIFTLIIPTGALLVRNKDKILLYLLTVTGFIMSSVMLLIPWFRWNKGYGDNWILKTISSFINFDITGFFPSIPVSGKFEILPLIFWAVVVVILNVFVILRNRKGSRT